MIKNIIIYTGGALVVCLAIYFMAVLAKEVSYKLFYEDKVKETIIEMVKPEYLATGTLEQNGNREK